MKQLSSKIVKQLGANNTLNLVFSPDNAVMKNRENDLLLNCQLAPNRPVIENGHRGYSPSSEYRVTV